MLIDLKNNPTAVFILADKLAKKELSLLISMWATTFATWKCIAADNIVRKLDIIDSTEKELKDLAIVIRYELLPSLCADDFTNISRDLLKELK